MARLDLVGKNFNRLTVLSFYDVSPKDNRTRWLCRCECGNEMIAVGSEMNRGNTESCGCLTREKRVNNKTTHGHSGKRLYKTWGHMLGRCNDKNHDSYKYYGLKGIRVCPEWHDVDNFVKWATANGYENGLTIDRIDNRKGYAPSNCRWATSKEQANNRSTNLIISHEGKEKNLTQWAEFYGLNTKKIYSRYYRGDRGNDLFRTTKGGI